MYVSFPEALQFAAYFLFVVLLFGKLIAETFNALIRMSEENVIVGVIGFLVLIVIAPFANFFVAVIFNLSGVVFVPIALGVLFRFLVTRPNKLPSTTEVAFLISGSVSFFTWIVPNLKYLS